MFSYEERLNIITLYIANKYNAKKTANQLGNVSESSIRSWYKEFEKQGDLNHTGKTSAIYQYTLKERAFAVEQYFRFGSYKKTVEHLGYPSPTTLVTWVTQALSISSNCNPQHRVVKCSLEMKEQAVIALCTRQRTAQEVADAFAVSRMTLYRWRNELLGEESGMSAEKDNLQQNIERAKTDPVTTLGQYKAELARVQQELAKAKKEYEDLQLENAVLKEAAKVLKKGVGVDLEFLANREKAIVIDALRSKFPLKVLLGYLKMAKSCYYYQKSIMGKDKYAELRIEIADIFHREKGRYGYRRIDSVLRDTGTVISPRVIRRLMAEEHLIAKYPKTKRKYCSYKGEISPAVPNHINRNFHASAPNVKWLTDITEFSLPAGKVYLSPIIDCFDGMVVSWTIGKSPNAELVNSMLDKAISLLKDGKRPIIHSDRGCHYQWPGWIERMERAGLTRSMSKKGYTPDNSACEGFFGRLKNEMFYERSWDNVSLEEFTAELDSYIHWYNEHRVKSSLGGMSPLKYRQKLGLVA